ncbi:hypothetical protein LCGC14_0163670 [marine sediment metagenome]|uniref:HNH endonuclease n=1 Tax=marine sediment metagenome TaxID=412755 RepID=A0A0F9XWF7_9ZZZZ
MLISYFAGQDEHYHVIASCMAEPRIIRLADAIDEGLTLCPHCKDVAVKRCSKCRQTQPISAHHRNRKKADGLANQCRDCRNSSAKAYATNNREHINKQQREYRNRSYAKHRDRYLARSAVESAVLRGRMVKPDCCSECGADGRLEAHHEDYSRRLDVLWLCSDCHGKRHASEDMPRPDAGRNVPVEVVREVLRDRNLAETARTCGVPEDTIYHIFYQSKKAVRRSTVEKLEAGLGIKILVS